MRMTRITKDNNAQPDLARMKRQRDGPWALSLLVAVSCAASAMMMTTNLPITEAFPLHCNKPATTIAADNRGVRQRRNLSELYNKDPTDDSHHDETSSSSIPHKQQQQLLGNLLAATTLATLLPIVANAADLDLVSPGTTIIEAKTKDASKLLEKTETTASNLLDTAVWNAQNRKALLESTKRIQSTISTELSSVEAWRQVLAILKDYGVDLQKETSVVVRPPADLGRAVGDATNQKKVTLLVNGEILQIEAKYQKGTNTKQDLQEGKAVQPDDEWILTIKGYKGFDPDAIILPETKKVNPLFNYERKRPVWFQKWDKFWHDPLDEKNPFRKITKTHGDAIVVGGSTAIALSYAASYAYYLDQIEQEEAAAAKKKELAAAKKKAAAAAKKKQADETAKETPKKKGFFGGGGDKKKKKKEKPAPKKKVDKPKPAPKKKVEKPKKADKPPKQETTAKDEKKVEDKSKPAAVETKKKFAAKEATKEAVEKKEKEPTKTEATVAAAVDETPKAKDVSKKEAPKKKEVPQKKENPTKEESKTDNDEDDEDDSVKVVIDFDKDGKVVITTVDAPSPPKRESPIALAQSLLFPWLGFFVSSRLDRDDRRSPIRFVQSLLFPWAGVLFRREQSTTSAGASKDENKKKKNKKK